MKMHNAINGVMFDLDGVLYVEDQIIDGAVETLRFVQERSIPHRFVTNTSTKSRQAISRKLQTMGIPAQREDIFSAPYAASIYLRQRQPRSCYFVVADDVMEEFKEFPVSETDPEVVVIGDIGRVWNYDLVNQIFQLVMKGSELIALHKGKYWQTPQGLRVDIGVYIAGLEYVTGVQATIIGKPSPAFFESAVEEMGVPGEGIVMLGDDIESDVGGAQRCGIRGFLVRTGKFRPETMAASSITPDAVLGSIVDLKQYLAP
jgi:HAD superfamily hydrolase (TIGR01458 family)